LQNAAEMNRISTYIGCQHTLEAPQLASSINSHQHRA
jgi:hypothetical protein